MCTRQNSTRQTLMEEDDQTIINDIVQYIYTDITMHNIINGIVTIGIKLFRFHQQLDLKIRVQN